MSIKSKIISKAKNNRGLIENFSYLSVLEIVNLLLPLATYPYLLKTLGNETYGLIVFAQAIIAYFSLLINFGFGYTGTRNIANNRDNTKKISEIFSSLTIIKSFLWLFGLVILSFLIVSIPNFSAEKKLFFITYSLCFTEFLFPKYFFQGIEKMKFITIITLISRLFFLLLVFFLVRNEEDYLFVPFLNGAGALLGAIISQFYILKRFNIRFIIPKLDVVFFHFKESIPLFVSNLSTTLYLKSNRIIIGSLIGFSEVAYYDLGDKLLTVLKIPISILSKVLFPKMSNKYNPRLLWITIKWIFMVTMLLILVVYIFSTNIVLFVGGDKMLPSVKIIKILTLSLLPLIISNGLGTQTLLAKGYNKIFSFGIISATLLYILYILLIIFFGVVNIYLVSLSLVLLEIFMLIFYFFSAKKLNLLKNE